MRKRIFLNERIKYSDEPLGDLKVVPDFLPRPQDLVKHNTQYQRMIRRLLDAYAEHHAQRTSTARSPRPRYKTRRSG